MQFDQPRVVLRICQDVSLRTNVGQLIFLEHFRLDEGFERIDLAITFPLDQLDFTKCTLSDDLDGLEVCGSLFGAQKTEEPGFFLRQSFRLLTLLCIGHAVALEQLVEVDRTVQDQGRLEINYSHADSTIFEYKTEDLPHIALASPFNILLEEDIDQLLRRPSTLVNIV